MATQLRISLGQVTDKGRKPINQDFHGAVVPNEPQLSSKGIVAALADGISSSEVSQIASAVAIKGFLEDYYATSEAWTVKTSAQRVLQATNSWLYAQTWNKPNRYNLDRGYVCTFSALVFKSTTAHLFHLGDSRICRINENHLEQLTEDHRLWVSADKSYLSRALGMREGLEVDYAALPITLGDTFLLMTDGVYEFVAENKLIDLINSNADDLDSAAQQIIDSALENGSDDNLSIQIIRVDELPQHDLQELNQQAESLPFPPELRPRITFDGYHIQRQLHASSRSHVFLAVDEETQQQVALKAPSVDLRDNTEYLERFLMEEWIARRLDNAHLLKACQQTRKRNFLYSVTEYIEGQTLNQWMIDNPQPNVESVRNIIEQIATGLQALHHQEMLHQDLNPNNIMIDQNGTVKIIDFGTVRVAGIVEMARNVEQQPILGTAQYTAPEYFVGEMGDTRSDLFSLGVITYQMLSGRLPYGAQVARTNNRTAQHRLVYQSVLDDKRRLPGWVDTVIRKAVHANPNKRYQELSEFVHDLRKPNPALLNHHQPLLERNPILFWKGLSLALFIACLILLFIHPLMRSF
jgi:serine/threonine protein phosphatase PrpC